MRDVITIFPISNKNVRLFFLSRKREGRRLLFISLSFYCSSNFKSQKEKMENVRRLLASVLYCIEIDCFCCEVFHGAPAMFG